MQVVAGITRSAGNALPAAALASYAVVAAGAAGAAVTVQTDKELYAPGETVFLTVHNGLAETVTAPAVPPWQVVDPVAMQVVGVCVALPGSFPIGAGGTQVFSWPQIDCGTGSAAGPGVYWAEFTYSRGSTPGRSETARAAFCLQSDCDPVGPVAAPEDLEASPWGRVKSLYR